jgi:hypothetical protein
MTDPRPEKPGPDKAPLLSGQQPDLRRAVRRRFAAVSAVMLVAGGIVANEAGWLPALDSFNQHSAPAPDAGKAAVPAIAVRTALPDNPELPSRRINREAAEAVHYGPHEQTIEETVKQGEVDAVATDALVKMLKTVPTPAAMPPELRAIHDLQRKFMDEGKPPPPFEISRAIQYASDYTGVDMEYLHRLALAESTYRAGITNKDGGGKGACGLYQFRASSTYLEAIYRHGDKFPEEYRHLANTVELYVEKRTRKGPEYAYRIKRGVDKDMVYNACYDPRFASVLAALHTLDLEDAIKTRVELDRPVNQAEVYLSHFLGENGGPKLISAYVDEDTRNARVTKYVSSRQRNANRGIFNKVRTVDDLYEYFVEDKGMTDEPLDVKPPKFEEQPVRLPKHAPLPVPRPKHI